MSDETPRRVKKARRGADGLPVNSACLEVRQERQEGESASTSWRRAGPRHPHDSQRRLLPGAGRRRAAGRDAAAAAGRQRRQRDRALERRPQKRRRRPRSTRRRAADAREPARHRRAERTRRSASWRCASPSPTSRSTASRFPTARSSRCRDRASSKLGESYPAGPNVSLAAISNYLTVPFRSYVVVPSRGDVPRSQQSTVAHRSALLGDDAISTAADMEQLARERLVDPQAEHRDRAAAGQADQTGDADVLRAAERASRRPAQDVVGRRREQGRRRSRASSCTTARDCPASPATRPSSSSAPASAWSTPRTPTTSTSQDASHRSAGKLSQGDEVAKVLGVGPSEESTVRPGRRRRDRDHRQGLQAACERIHRRNQVTSEELALTANEAASDKKASTSSRSTSASCWS